MLRGGREVTPLLSTHAAVVPCLCLIMCCLLTENGENNPLFRGQHQNYWSKTVETFQANSFGVGSCWLSKLEAFHIHILFKISGKSFEPFFNLPSQQHLIPIIISDVLHNVCCYKALWKAISVFYFANFWIFNYKANLNILTSSREGGKLILKSVVPEVGQYLMQMWGQHLT